MHEEKFTDEVLMAYADGELDAKTRRQVEDAIGKDSALASRVETFMKTRALLAGTFGTAKVSVPDNLEARVRQMAGAQGGDDDTVVPFAPRSTPPKTGFAQSFALPIAASLALVAGGLLGYMAAGQPSGMDVAGLANHQIVEALNASVSGETREFGADGRFEAIATYRDGTNALCREFEVRTGGASHVAVACRNEENWQLRFATAQTDAGGDFVPASSLEALDAFLAATKAGEPLTAEEERNALSSLR
ncbi:anti-sigma factor [uncultured Nitratireductor sp.]|uniref:anti-sigma factor family protein n=1 Tax=uncultured Nitratireductor sp. TaxID=520953 RepID=UPI0025CF73EB|nr:anti-sigma factor [uncultured Nitratireductor sp.]